MILRGFGVADDANVHDECEICEEIENGNIRYVVV